MLTFASECILLNAEFLTQLNGGELGRAAESALFRFDGTATFAQGNRIQLARPGLLSRLSQCMGWLQQNATRVRGK